MAGAAGIDSDDFSSGSLESFWTETDPVGDVTVAFEGAGTSNAYCVLTAPNDEEHDFWTTNDTGRLLQPCTDDDFEIEVKLATVPAASTQTIGWGLTIEESGGTFIRFDLIRHDTGNHYLICASDLGGTPTARRNGSITEATAPFWLKATRTGDSFAFRYSTDGFDTSDVAWTSFSWVKTITDVGIHVMSFETTYDAVAKFDYFFENSDRIDPEDPESGGTRRIMVIS